MLKTNEQDFLRELKEYLLNKYHVDLYITPAYWQKYASNGDTIFSGTINAIYFEDNNILFIYDTYTEKDIYKFINKHLTKMGCIKET